MIIDMRCRPPFGTYMQDGVLYDPDSIRSFSKLMNTKPSEAALKRDLDLFFKEMDEAGIDKAVAPVRVTCNGKNEVAADMIQKYPDRFIALLGINAMDDIQYSLDMIDKYVVHGDFAAVSVEPGFTPEPYAKDGLTCDDKLYYPIYEKCQKEGKSVLISFGGMCHEGIDKFSPETLDKVLRDFPKLKVIICHGGFPWIPQVFWIAQRRGNLYISPDMYVAAGGGDQYIQAARYLLQGKILFGSAYPACSMKKAVELYNEFNMEEHIYKQIMGEAAIEALGL